MYLTGKNVDYIFKEPLNVHIFNSFFLSPLSSLKQSEAGETISFQQQTELGEHNNPDTLNRLIIFSSAIAVMQMIF